MRYAFLRISLVTCGGITLGMFWGGLWLALNFFAYLGLDAIGDFLGGDGELRLAQVVIAGLLLVATIGVAAALVHLARTLGARPAVPILSALATVALLSSVAVAGLLHEERGCPSVAQWLPLLAPCGN